MGWKGLAVGVHGVIEAGGEEAGLEAGAAEERVLGDGDALDGEEFLGVGGAVTGHEIGAEIGDGLGVFETDDGEFDGGEAVPAGILGGAGLTFGGFWSGRVGGVGAIGGEPLLGNGFFRVRHK